jgi:hypothetical protein
LRNIEPCIVSSGLALRECPPQRGRLAALYASHPGRAAELDRYIGYWEPYATSHDALDADTAMQEEVRNAARTLVEAVQASRAGQQIAAGSGLKPVRQK